MMSWGMIARVLKKSQERAERGQDKKIQKVA